MGSDIRERGDYLVNGFSKLDHLHRQNEVRPPYLIENIKSMWSKYFIMEKKL